MLSRVLMRSVSRRWLSRLLKEPESVAPLESKCVYYASFFAFALLNAPKLPSNASTRSNFWSARPLEHRCGVGGSGRPHKFKGCPP